MTGLEPDSEENNAINKEGDGRSLRRKTRNCFKLTELKEAILQQIREQQPNSPSTNSPFIFPSKIKCSLGAPFLAQPFLTLLSSLPLSFTAPVFYLVQQSQLVQVHNYHYQNMRMFQVAICVSKFQFIIFKELSIALKYSIIISFPRVGPFLGFNSQGPTSALLCFQLRDS